MGRAGQKATRLQATDGPLFDDLASEGDSISSHSEAFDPRNPEQCYRILVSLQHRKRLGQFFTPEPIAQLMAEWVSQCKPHTVLDPAVGPGVFLRLLHRLAPDAQLKGIDIDPSAISAAKRCLDLTKTNLVQGDFLTWESSETFDAILANPPYLRHHDLNYQIDIHEEVGRKNSLNLSRLTNIYVLFILEICRRLKPGGRAAIIVPGEWTNANYGMALKQFLLGHGYLHTLIYFSNLSELFEDALTTASILLIEKPSSKHVPTHFESLFVPIGVDVDELHLAISTHRSVPGTVVHHRFKSDELATQEKWDKIIREGLPEEKEGFVPLNNIASSRRGIATGANKFFHIPESEVRKWKLRPENLKKCIGRAEDVSGLVFTGNDFELLRSQDKRTWLVSVESPPNSYESSYLETGVADGLHERYLLAKRKPWYSMERRAPSPIWAAVFGRSSLRFIYNEAGIHNLTTFHCIYPKNADPTYCRALVACLNSRTVQELAEHQRRVYGAGLIKFEPRDLLSIQIPLLDRVPNKLLNQLAQMLDELDKSLRETKKIPPSVMDKLDDLVQKAALVSLK